MGLSWPSLPQKCVFEDGLGSQGAENWYVPKNCSNWYDLEPVIIMSPAEMTVGPNRSQIKVWPLWISKNGPTWQYRNVFILGTM